MEVKFLKEERESILRVKKRRRVSFVNILGPGTVQFHHGQYRVIRPILKDNIASKPVR